MTGVQTCALPIYKGALRSFSGELGNEGKSILRSLMYEKEKEEENND